MTAIAGVLWTDGRDASVEDARGLEQALAHRGPHGVEIDGPVVLLGTVEREGDLIVTSHGSLDDPRRTAEAVRVDPDASVGTIILAAYRRWGRDLAARLRGPVAFAVWDRALRSLMCVRDRFGTRPFAYHRGSARFAFASEPRGLLTLPEVLAEPDESMIAMALVDELDDEQRTFWRGIWRLPAASVMVVGERNRSPRRYWRPDAPGTLVLRSDGEYEEAFREVFVTAVRRAIPPSGTVGTELSGGLDSSAVTCVARDLFVAQERAPLDAFTAAFEGQGSDESRWVAAVTATGHIVHHTVDLPDVARRDAVEASVAAQGEPYAGPTVLMENALYDAAGRAGVAVILDGFDGDTVVSHGVARLTDLLRQIRIRDLAIEASAYARFIGAPLSSVLRSEVVGPLLPGPVLGAWRRLRDGRPDDGVLRDDVARRVDLPSLLSSRDRRRARSASEEHARDVTAGMNAIALEIRDRAAAAAGIELRHPFFDVDLVEFCLALPRDQVFREGVTRSIMRRALAPVLPPIITGRAEKAVLPAAVPEVVLSQHDARIRSLRSGTGAASAYVDPTALGVAEERSVLLNAVALDVWLGDIRELGRKSR